jgi:hypothetical protein
MRVTPSTRRFARPGNDSAPPRRTGYDCRLSSGTSALRVLIAFDEVARRRRLASPVLTSIDIASSKTESRSSSRRARYGLARSRSRASPSPIPMYCRENSSTETPTAGSTNGRGSPHFATSSDSPLRSGASVNGSNRSTKRGSRASRRTFPTAAERSRSGSTSQHYGSASPSLSRTIESASRGGARGPSNSVNAATRPSIRVGSSASTTSTTARRFRPGCGAAESAVGRTVSRQNGSMWPMAVRSRRVETRVPSTYRA